MQEEEIIIIGSGISGLYAAYKLKSIHPNSKITILEQNRMIGGRMGKQLLFLNL